MQQIFVRPLHAAIVSLATATVHAAPLASVLPPEASWRGKSEALVVQPAAALATPNETMPHLGLRISAEGPRYSTGYGDFTGVPTVLVENHAMKPYKRRVLGTYVLLEQSLRTVGREGTRIAEGKERMVGHVARREMAMPAGSVRIPADQPFRLLAAALLEPESDDSLLAGGLLDNALPPESSLKRHLLAPMADRLMETNPGLRTLFQETLARDAAFAADSRARLAWWLERSEYGDRSSWTYPVFMERE